MNKSDLREEDQTVNTTISLASLEKGEREGRLALNNPLEKCSLWRTEPTLDECGGRMELGRVHITESIPKMPSSVYVIAVNHQ